MFEDKAQRINRLRDYFEMTVTPSLFIKSFIYTCRTDMYQMINHLHQKKIRSNRSIEKLHETNFRVIEILIRCGTHWLM